MKKIKTFLSVAVAAALGCMSFAACGGGEEDSGRATAETGHLVVRIVDKGYGTEWLDQIIASYEAANEGCTVEVKKSNDSGSAASRAQSASNDADILISTDSLWRLQNDGYLYDISEVYNSVQEGEDVALKDRMNQSFREFFETDDNKFYQMSWVESYAGYLYNKDVLDEVYGEGKYTLPRTTDELLEMCEYLATQTAGGQKIEPIALSTSQSYYDLIKYTWFAQYLGAEKYSNLLRGYYENDTGEYVPCETVEEFTDMIDAEGRIKVYDVIRDLVVNYAHSESERMSYTDSQNAFIGIGYGTNYTKCAFYLIGDWFFTEMAGSLQNSGADIRYMKTVVLSDMVDTLENTAMTDDQLCAFIDCVDGGEYDSTYTGYSEITAETSPTLERAIEKSQTGNSEEIFADSSAWWKDYWQKSYVDIYDKTVEKYYYTALYIVGGATRDQNVPSSLFGPYISSDSMAWGGTYVTDYNLYGTYMAVAACNRADLLKPLVINALESWGGLEELGGGIGRDYADRFNEATLSRFRNSDGTLMFKNGVDGVLHAVASAPHGYAISMAGFDHILFTSAYAALPVLSYFDMTQGTGVIEGDLVLTRELEYEYLKDIMALWEQILIYENGVYKVKYDSAWEYEANNMGNAFTIACMHKFTQRLVADAEALGIDENEEPRILKWKHIDEHMEAYPTAMVQDAPLPGNAIPIPGRPLTRST